MTGGSQSCWGGRCRISWALLVGATPNLLEAQVLSLPFPNPKDAKQATTRENSVQSHFYRVISTGRRGRRTSALLKSNFNYNFRTRVSGCPVV